MKYFIRSIIILHFLFIGFIGFSQSVTQTIRGKVIDKDAKTPLFGANLVIADSDPQIGVSSDFDGNFKFEELPIGRYNLIIYYMGYESRTIPNLLLGSGKEIVLTIELSESVINLNEVIVIDQKSKSETLNKMATVSARSFTVEETRKYAGSMNDPSRMASSFAGVNSSPSGNNDIIVRGNSPRGMLWRLEGIDIPNPNHFAEEGSTGGPISILNSATLNNSDFFTGAFPAEYGNAYSGVFDIKLRNGNNQKREYTIQAGILGTDCTLEGPFSKKSSASYLFNYRYSTLGMLNAIGINIAGDAVPEFQDLTFKVNLPTQKAGIFTLFGIGGISSVHEKDDLFRNDFRTDMGAMGLSNTYFLDEQTYIKSYVAYTGSRNIWTYEEPNENNAFYKKASENFIYETSKISTSINRKFNSRNVGKIGIIYNEMKYNLFTDSYDNETEQLITEVNEEGRTALLQTYANWKYRFNEELTFVGGLHSMYFMFNNNYTIEPRLGFKWQFKEKQALTGGFGIHSKMESLSTYFAINTAEDGTISQPNKDLDFTKAMHFVAGYENMLREDLFLKLEVYYQYLYDVPIENNDTSTFSSLNYSEGYTTRKLVNNGDGSNLGLELTLEKYFSNNYYFMVTSSIYDSKYKAADGIMRDTRYNGNYVFNLLGGKEFRIGKPEKKRTLTVSLKGTWAGGQRSTPIDMVQSDLEGYTVRHEDLAFSEQWNDFIRYDFKVSLTRNRPKATHTIELDIQNATNRLNVVGDYYDWDTGEVETFTQLGLVPVLNYRVEF